MKKWKKFIAMGLAVSMIVPSCIPQTLWASEFSAGSVEPAADVFEFEVMIWSCVSGPITTIVIKKVKIRNLNSSVLHSVSFR